MGEIKISTSNKLNENIEKGADGIGIKKAEFVKNLVVDYVKNKESKGVEND